jgi:anti-sigma factor RsiW
VITRTESGRRGGSVESAGTQFFEDAAVLVVEPGFNDSFAPGIQRKQVGIARGPAMHDAAATKDGSFDERVRQAAIFGLHVESSGAERDVGVVASEHRSVDAGFLRRRSQQRIT